MKKEYIQYTIGIFAGVILITIGVLYSQKKPTPILVPTPTANVNEVTLPTPDETPITNSKITVDSPKVFQSINSPLTVTGQAVGNWYFEASFPIQVLDANGKLLGQVPAQAQSDWMVETFVPFKATITFEKPTTSTGTIVLKKDNPSGLPQYDESVTIPVKFQTTAATTPTTSSGCVVTGCSGQICASEKQITTCEFKPEYACYKTATCEKQASGGCGWTSTPELAACLSSSK